MKVWISIFYRAVFFEKKIKLKTVFILTQNQNVL